MASGGYRQPSNPAAVSGPGALSQRTDGGAGSAKQPIRVPTGGKYGEAKALEEQEKAAPMAVRGQPTGQAGAAANPQSPPQLPPQQPQGVFHPTNRPTEPITTGVTSMLNVPGAPPPDPDMVIRMLIQKYPSPYLTRLLDG